MSEDMPKAYEPKATESTWYARWLERGYFVAHADSGKEPFCIVLPPPNVTGQLHIGHAFMLTNQDVIVRRKRMQGYETLWLPGTDHAGIGTEVVVKRELEKEGLTREELGREKFIERVWAWKEQYGDRIVVQMQALGNSCDWTRLRFTADEGLSRAVREAFVRWYDDGLIYRGERIVNWCPKDGTALSDSEVEHDDVDGELVTFTYPLTEGEGGIDVATTRVETMLGDTGIAVNPDDERYRDLVGGRVRHPFDGRDLPIVADAAVDPAFGTGAVKVTPAHDPNDFEIAERQGLERLNILDASAHINENAPAEFRGLDRYEARTAVREALEAKGLLVTEERPYVHSVGHCYRCHSEIEPWLSGKQWFVKVGPLTGPARAVAEDGRLRFFPERWKKPYVDWLDKLRDWNISRQLWWGHRIPVWYCANGHEFASREDPTACPDCGSAEIEQDPDVLDTWFSSQLWPFSTLGWPDDTEDLRTFYPTSVLVTGYEILYLWVARMVMSGLNLAGDLPFRHAMIHGLIRDERGRKMSKSLGNVIDPLDMVERYGADALRFALLRQGTGGQDIPLSVEGIELGRNFANKVWNAGRLVLSRHPGGAPERPEGPRTLVERWILSRHERCRAEVDAAIEEYRFSEAAVALQRFLWAELADWGLEMQKSRLADQEMASDAANVLAWVLERTLRLLHPVMPFVTEEIWQRFDAGESIMIADWPEAHPEDADGDLEAALEFFQELVTRARELDASIRAGNAFERDVTDAQRASLRALAPEFTKLTRLEVDVPDEGPIRVTGAARTVETSDAERDRLRTVLEGRLKEAEDKLAREEAKLANPDFVNKAKPEAVEKAKANRDRLSEEIRVLRGQIESP
jgi:valyl-tRNA synthetase